MPSSTAGPLFEEFLAAAEAVARARPEVDPEMAREVFHEAATLLDNGLALDGLDAHDTAAVVAGLCADLVAEDPGAAVRHGPGRSRRTPETCTTRQPCRRPTWSPPPSCSCDGYRRPMVPTSMDLPLMPSTTTRKPSGVVPSRSFSNVSAGGS